MGYRDEDWLAVERQIEVAGGQSHKIVERVLKQGARLVPQGVAYDRLAVLLLDVVKRQETRLAALEAKV
jgi:hypothetical protein